MIKLLVPKAPTSEQLLPYLKRIDEARWYTNFGPLVKELEQRLEDKYGAHVVTTSSCTAGLEIVWERLYREGNVTLVGVPALTFPASALAPRRVGLNIYFCDVSRETWTDPGVSGFGYPETGTVLDAAGAFGEQTVAKHQTAVFSLHATKVLSGGEGGYIVTHDPVAAKDYRRMTNFGLRDGTSRGLGTNAKMSEYHAAVARASLDAYSREPWLQLFDWYEKHLPASVIKQARPRGVYPMIAVRLPCPVAPVMASMALAEVETRRWYYPNLARHPLFESEEPPITAKLSERLLGLPWHLFLTEQDVISVCQALNNAIQHSE